MFARATSSNGHSPILIILASHSIPCPPNRAYAEEDIQDLLANVEQRKGKVLESQRAEITEYLEDYLVQKHFGLEGTLERGLARDAQINTAASILLEQGTMDALLGVK